MARIGAQRWPETVAVRCGDATRTWRDLDDAATRVAGALQAAGSQPGDRVAYLGKNGVEVFELVFGASRARAAVLPLNWRMTDAELRGVLADGTPRVLVAGPADRERAERLAPGTSTAIADPAGLRSAAPTERPAPPGCGDDAALVVQTSGTTGVAKLAVHTHTTFLATVACYRAAPEPWAQPERGAGLLVHLPLFHVGGLFGALQHLAAGGTLVVVEQFDPDLVADLVETHRIQVIQMVPTMLQALLAVPGIEQRDLTSLRSIFYGGSPMPATLLHRSQELFGCQFSQHYGSTECCGAASYLAAAEHDRPEPDATRLATVGVPFPGMDVKVVAPDGTDAAPGEQGELCVKSPGLMVGYLGDPAATDRVLRDGWLHTGDLGSRSADGFITLSGRLHDVISSGGETISLRELELAIEDHPAVDDVAVIGAPHARWGETPRAIVVARAGHQLDEATLREHLRDRVAPYKLPTIWEFRPMLPRNAMGKVLKHVLRDETRPGAHP